jgi:SagB-type dehydrogenase family enzyme
MKHIIQFQAILVFLANAGLASCAVPADTFEALASPFEQITAPALQSPTPQAQYIDLPAPSLKGTLTLEEALARRRSVRQFSAEALTMQELGQLLWAAQGITHPAGLRTAPSAGALYPLEIYAVTPEGVYHYEPQGHRLALHLTGDARATLYDAALKQAAVRQAPAVIVIAAVYARTTEKYGDERSPRYVHLEAGHAAQNILLQAVALELGAVPIGAFYDDQVKKTLALPEDQQPLYLIPGGHPM